MSQEKNRCPHCGQVIDKREIALYKGLVEALAEVYKWNREKGVHEFKMRDIRHLIGQVNYARFGDWVFFGGLVYKNEKAHYGLNMERCREFFAGRSTIPTRVWKDPMTGEIEKCDYRTVRDIPGVVEFLNEKGLYEAKYTAAQLSL